MSVELAIATALFCFAGSLTPGPNNIMLLASGVNFGFARTLPHMAGVVAGYAFLLLMVGLGIGQSVMAHPTALLALKIAGATYLVWLAWKVATATGGAKGEGRGTPMSFLQAVAFQWINVKGVLMGISAVAAFTRPAAFGATLATLISVSFVANVTSVLVWTLFGTALRGFLSDPRNARIFNGLMAALLVASLYPMLADV